MAVFAWALGDPFSYELDETPFYDAVSDFSSDVFHFAADTRLTSQSNMYSALTYRTHDVRRWITHGDTDPTFEQWFEFALIVAIVAFVQFAPYVGPLAFVTAPIAFVLDAYNIYQHFL